MPTYSNPLRSPRFLLGVVTILLVLSFIPTSGSTVLETGIDKAGAGFIRERATEYLEVQRERALEGFLVLSALKVGLAVLRSSEVGLILNVKIGDLAIAVYDYVNFAWKVLLAAVAYYFLAEYLLDLTSAVWIWFLWAGFLFLIFGLGFSVFRPGWPRSRVVMSRAGMAGLVLAAILYFALPLTFVGAGWVSDHITDRPIREATSLYQQIRDEIPRFSERGEKPQTGQSEIRTPSITVPVPYYGTDPSGVTIEDGQNAGEGNRFLSGIIPVERIRELGEYLQSRSRSLASAVLRQTAAYLFNIVVFPILMILVLYWGGKYSLSLALTSPRFHPREKG